MARVVVGVDGSSESFRALDLAVQLAVQRAQPLLVVSAWSLPMVATPYPISLDPHDFEEAGRHALDTAATRASAVDADLVVTTELVDDDPRPALLDRVGPDDLLVVGSRGLSGLASVLVGSVASYCVRHARCPVMVVPPAR